MNWWKQLFTSEKAPTVTFQTQRYQNSTPDHVQAYYEQWTDHYLTDLGWYIQAMQTTEPEDFMRYIADSIGIQDGMTLLDAGCGVCGPAITLAKWFDIKIEAITISPKQKIYAEKLIAEANLKGKINVIHGDYHQLSEYYKANTFDIVYFLESLTHSHQPETVVQEVYKVLKNKGLLYIKDLYEGPKNPTKPGSVEYAIQATNEQFCLQTRPVGDILNLLTQFGFWIQYCRIPTIPVDFEKGNAFTAKYLFKLREDQTGPWRDEGFVFLHWLETLAIKHY